MSTEDNKALVRRFNEEVITRRIRLPSMNSSTSITSITLPLLVCQAGSWESNKTSTCS